MGAVATTFRAGARFGRFALLPGRILIRTPLVRGRAEGLAVVGREAEQRGRRRLEEAAGGVLAAPETARTIDRALVGTIPDETLEQLARRLLDSPAFERVLRDAAESRVVRDLLDDASRSAELQRALEEALAGPALRRALARQRRTLWDEVADRLVDGTARADDACERVAHRVVGRHVQPAQTSAHGGLASRAAAFLFDAVLANLVVLGVAAAVGVLGALLGVSLPGVLVGVVAGAGWALFLACYFVVFWSTAGQTPGLRTLRLRVAGPGGGPPGVRRSLLRLAGSVVALVPLGAGLVPVLFDGRRRALQDLLARTVVVRQRSSDAGEVGASTRREDATAWQAASSSEPSRSHSSSPAART